MQATTPEDILSFWLDDVGPSRWFNADPELDQTIRQRFMGAWRLAAEGELDDWSLRPEGAMALLVLLDQFPRNMFRGSDAAFASDRKALAVAKRALCEGHDLRVDETARFLYYLPLMHSECITDQERCVRLIMTRMPQTGAEKLKYAREHRDLIRKFGRFPYRNEALGRRTTPPEQSFLEAAGYAA